MGTRSGGTSNRDRKFIKAAFDDDASRFEKVKASKAITESSPVFSPTASQTTIPVGLCLALDRNPFLMAEKAVIPGVEIGNDSRQPFEFPMVRWRDLTIC